MSAEPARHLRPVEEDTRELQVVDRNGEARPLGDYLQPLEDQLAGAEKEIRAWRTRYYNLRRDKDAEAKASPYWPLAKRLFDYWRRKCKHERCQFTADRFETLLPHLHADPLLCVKAIDGAAFDPFIPPPGKNGKRRPKNDWSLIFREQGKVNEFAARVRDDWQPPAGFVEAIKQTDAQFERLPVDGGQPDE